MKKKANKKNYKNTKHRFSTRKALKDLDQYKLKQNHLGRRILESYPNSTYMYQGKTISSCGELHKTYLTL